MKKIIFIVISCIFSLSFTLSSQASQLGDEFDLGILAHTMNPWEQHNSGGYEIGVATWFQNFVGLDLTFSYTGADDGSRVTKGTSTYYYDDVSGIYTTRNYYDAGEIRYRDKTDQRMSISLMPKMKVIRNKQSYLFVGLPLFYSMGYKQDNGYRNLNKGWTNTGDANPADDYISSVTDIDYTYEREYKNWFGGALAVGGAFQFENIPGLELSFIIAFRWGPGRKREQKHSYKRTTTTYDASGNATSVVTYEGSSVPDGQTVNGEIENDKTGTSTTGNGAIYVLGITYYFM